MSFRILKGQFNIPANNVSFDIRSITFFVYTNIHTPWNLVLNQWVKQLPPLKTNKKRSQKNKKKITKQEPTKKKYTP